MESIYTHPAKKLKPKYQPSLLSFKNQNWYSIPKIPIRKHRDQKKYF